MSDVGWIVFWWLAFGVSHSGLSHLTLRTVLVERCGARTFAALYSLISLATFVPLVRTYWGVRHGGAHLWSLQGVPGVWAIAVGIGLLAFALLAAALVAPSPVSMAGGQSRVTGMMHVTRHPLFVAMALWAVAHLLVTGTSTDVVFFGGFLVYSLAGAAHQDQRKRVEGAGRLAAFYQQTSLLPFGAALTGRTRMRLGELPWLALALGVAMGIGVYQLHPMLFW